MTRVYACYQATSKHNTPFVLAQIDFGVPLAPHRAQFFQDRCVPAEVCAMPTERVIAMQDLLDQIVPKSAEEALRYHALVEEHAFLMDHVHVTKVDMETAAKRIARQAKECFAQEEVFFHHVHELCQVTSFLLGKCSETTGACLCTQFTGSFLIAGYYGDACEFVKYNRSGVSSFSTSVQSASKFANK